MGELRILTAAEQVASHLRTEILHGKLSGTMPGVLRLEAELGVNRNTLEAAMRLLKQENLLVPQDVSLICTDYDPAFEWCKPAISHFHWDRRPVVRRIVRLADNVSRGKRDIRQTLTLAEFLPAGTIGPVQTIANC